MREAEKTVLAAASDRERRTVGDMGRLIHGVAHTTALLTRPDATQKAMITCSRTVVRSEKITCCEGKVK